MSGNVPLLATFSLFNQCFIKRWTDERTGSFIVIITIKKIITIMIITI